MAKMGLSVKDDPRKVVDVAGRTWGPVVDGLTISALLRTKEDPDELPAITVAILNRGVAAQRITTHGWLDYFQLSVTDSTGAAAELTPYGRELMKPERMQAAAEMVLEPGEATEADIPIGSLYVMRKGRYRVQATCAVPGGGRLISNEIQVEA